MTKSEVIQELKDKITVLERMTYNFLDVPQVELRKTNKELEICNVCISALEEIQQYREIGTVEECGEARERQMAKKPILDTIYHQQYYCPNCEDFLARKNGNKPYHCICGQAIDWSDLE